MRVKTVYAPCLKSSFSDTNVPFVACVAETHDLAKKYIDNEVWGYTHDAWDTWDVISDHMDNFVSLKRRKDGEVITWYIQTMSLLMK